MTKKYITFDSVGVINDGLVKVCIGGECFWLRGGEKVDIVNCIGYVDNILINFEAHGLSYNDKVLFGYK